jgi:cysteine desulfurase
MWFIYILINLLLYSRFTTEQEVDYLIDILESSVNHLRNLSPLWEMA